MIRNLGRVAGDHSAVQWAFDRATLDGTAGDLARAVRTHGEPFMREVAELSRLEALMREWGFEDEWLVRVPIVRGLQGDHDGARAAFDDVRQRVESEADDPARARSSAGRERARFVAAFPAWLDCVP